MGRNKIAIKLIEEKGKREVTYSKRKNGIIKKASELSTLTGTDVSVIMWSPVGQLFQFPDDDRTAEIIGRYADLTLQERAKKK
jgi:hypothetical protein